MGDLTPVQGTPTPVSQSEIDAMSRYEIKITHTDNSFVYLLKVDRKTGFMDVLKMKKSQLKEAATQVAIHVSAETETKQ